MADQAFTLRENLSFNPFFPVLFTSEMTGLLIQ